MKFWSVRHWAVALAGVVVLVALVYGGVQLANDATLRDAIASTAPIAAVTIALLSVVVTSIGLASNWRRQQRAATLKAWSEWSDKSQPHRRTLSDFYGTHALTREQGTALVLAAEPRPADELTEEIKELRRVLKALVLVSNGLERIAVGVELKVFDLRTLRAVGGTIVVRHFQRTEGYVKARREAANLDVRQEKAYLSLEAISDLLDQQQIREKDRAIDKKRLARLRR